ncbi:ExeA family protein, partial [Lactiplantibacillus pentosus]|uniref:ExeA family protein n=1 Tax=Lactiplantibacillus pentosus TaxID=1589 RepID=UPI002182355A
SVSDFYSQLAISLGIEPAYRKAQKFRQIQERMAEMHDIERVTPILIIDEAQYLNGAIFDELMLITNFEMDAEKKCVIILVGLPALAQRIQRAQFEAFRQRLTINYQVIGMENKEAVQYVNDKFKAAGVLSPVINEEALKTIIKQAGESIRRLDLIITQCLILGANKQQRIIDNEIVF